MRYFDNNTTDNKYISNVTEYGLIAVILLSILLNIFWLSCENHDIIEDELAHIEYSHKWLQKIQNKSITYSIKSAFFISNRYPPFFYLLLSAFIHTATEPLLGARIFVCVLSFFCTLSLYIFLRRFSSQLISLFGVLIFLSYALFVFLSRVLYIEPFILLLLINTYHAYYLYYERKNYKYLLLVGFLFSLVLLTKFTTFFYIFPLVIVDFVYSFIITSEKFKFFKKFFYWLIYISIFPLLLAAPWYIHNLLTSTRSSVSGFKALTELGFFKGLSFNILHFFKYDINVFTKQFSGFIIAIFICVLLLFVIYVIKQKTRFFSFMLEGKGFILSALIFSWIFWIFVSGVLGIYVVSRYNFGYFYTASIIAILAGEIRSRNRLILSDIVLLILFIPLIANLYGLWIKDYKYNSKLKFFFNHPHYFAIKPSTNPSEMRELALSIANHYKSLGSPPNFWLKTINYHSSFSHFDVIRYNLTLHNTDIKTCWAYLPRHSGNVQLTDFTETNYLVFKIFSKEPGKSNNYYSFSINLPDSYKSILQHLGTYHLKDGTYSIYYLDINKIDEKIILDLIENGLKSEKNTKYEIFWDIEKYIFLLDNNRPTADIPMIEDIEIEIQSHKVLLPPHYFNRLKQKYEYLKTLLSKRDRNISVDAEQVSTQ